jgi:Tfp pilus assembly protein PilO
MTLMRRVALISLAGLLVVVAGWYLVFWRSETSHLHALKTQESKAVANVSQLETQLAALRVLQREVPAEDAALGKLDQDVPQGPSLDELLDVINHAATVAGVTLASVTTPEPSGWGGPSSTSTQGAASGPGPQTMTLAISVNGNNAGLLRFITALDSAPRLFVVDNFSLNSSSQSAIGSTALTVETYYVSSASGDPASDFSLAKVTSAPTPSRVVHAVAPLTHTTTAKSKSPAASQHHHS